jgi:hypothetical protein
MKHLFNILYLFGLLCVAVAARAQVPEVSFTTLPLNDMSAFKAQAGNWQVAGRASANPLVKYDLQTSAGKGILVNLPDDKKKDNLFTLLEHGDIELELEFMMARESNSGIYFQGRYELQLLDSYNMNFGTTAPGKHDCAAIYERWDDSKPEGQKGFEGKPPRANVTRAPGLWQHYRVLFQAPRFDEKGLKIANARFVQVFHNGVLVHENVEVTGPTRGPAFAAEAAFGPLMIQGDHGPVAFRNIRYRLHDKAPLKIENITYDLHNGVFEYPDQMKGLKPAISNRQTAALSWQVEEVSNEFAYEFKGNIRISQPGIYVFSMECNGAGQIEVNGQTLALLNRENWRGNPKGGAINLKAGTYPIRIRYSKWISWQRPVLGVFAEGPGIRKHALHAPGSLPAPEPEPQINLQALGQPYLLRSFVEAGGKRYTHAMSVGQPEGRVNYAYDMNKGTLLNTWRGGFVSAVNMWNDRGGGQNAIPLGSPVLLPAVPNVAKLGTPDAAWPDSTDFVFRGYEIHQSGHPGFMYSNATHSYTDVCSATPDNKALVRTITFTQGAPAGYYCLGAVGKIERSTDGIYRVDEHYYIQAAESDAHLQIVDTPDGRQRLLLSPPEGSKRLVYTIIW